MENTEHNFDSESNDMTAETVTQESPTTKTQVSIAEIKNLLERGFTRTKTAKAYNPEIGSIEEYYDLNPSQVTLMFKTPDLKGLKTKKIVNPEFELVD